MKFNVDKLTNTHRWLWVGLALATLSLCEGCKSVESTMVTRDESNQAWERHNCLNGIPITIKVPTHLKLFVFHKHYLDTVPDGDAFTLKPADIDVVVRDFAHELMYTEKVFFVDFKRPLAGTADLSIDMTEEQYIDRIQQEITEDTLKDVGNLLGTFAKGTSGNNIVSAAGNGEIIGFTPVKSLVAVGIFEVDDPAFEDKVKQFVDCHINKSHDAWVVPDGVKNINRAGIPYGDNLQVPYPDTPLCPDGDCHSIHNYPETGDHVR